LHDAQVVSAIRKRDTVTLVMDTSSAVSRFRGYCVHVCFNGVKSRVPLRDLAGQWWLYQEAHLCSRSRFSFHIMFDKSDVEVEADHLVIKQFKQQLLANITPPALRRCPIWEIADADEGVDGRGNIWVRPVKRRTISRSARSAIVSTKFTTQSGRELQGFFAITTRDNHVAIESGAVCFRGLQKLRFLAGNDAANGTLRCSRRTRNDLACALAQKDGDVFPIRYRLNARLFGEKGPMEGIMI
jgi:hypothetical protein